MNDIIQGLREIVEQETDDGFVDGVNQQVISCALAYILEKEEAVSPGKEHSGSGVTWWNICGACKTAINPNDKYCHECGKAVKWDG